MSKRVAILLSGSGHRDGTEIHEATLSLLALDKAGFEVKGFAPNREQNLVTNHVNAENMNETRNVMIESGRIMRGNVKDVKQANVNDFDALVIPGGLGAVINFCSYARDEGDCMIDIDVKNMILDFVKKGKPVGAICISPVLVAKALEGSGIQATLTIGNDEKVAADIVAFGCNHENCTVDNAVFDKEHKIITTPAYMLAKNISEVEAGISKLVSILAYSV